MKPPSSLPRRFHRFAGLFALLAVSLQLPAATVTVDASNVVGDVLIGQSGANVTPKFWTSTTPDYSAGLAESKIGTVRIAAYPVDSATAYTVADLDERVNRILSAGAVPLFFQGINNINRTHSQPKDAVFYAKLLKLDGTPGGTHATNMAYLVQRYKAPPFNLARQFWEVGNEPDINVNYKVEGAQEYIGIFQSIHNQLVSSGVRSNVVLCGPVLSWDYGFDTTRDTFMRDFLVACKNQVDVVTRHIYALIYPWESPLTDTAYNLLNSPVELIHFDHTQGNTRGEKALLAAMATAGVPSTVGTGVTEMNLFKNTVEHRFTITQGLWFLLSNHYSLYNPRSRLTTGFQFDIYNNGSGGGWLGFYDSGKNRSFAYWAAYIHGNLTGNEVLAKTSDDSHLVVTGTKDNQFVYVQVLNRNTSAITATVTLNNAAVTAPTVFKLTATANPLTGTSTAYGTLFSYAFPAMSAHVFRFPRTDYASEIIVDNDDPVNVVRIGSWYGATSTPGYHGVNYWHDNNGGKGSRAVRCLPPISSVGTYEVYARWTAHANRATNVPIDILQAGGATVTVTVDQTANGGVWYLLGTYSLDPSTVEVTIRNTGTNGYVIADAIRVVPASEDVVVDNSDSARVTLTGSWVSSTSGVGYQGADYLHDNNQGKGSKSVRFAAPISAVGPYNVYVRWTSNANRATNVPIDIVTQGGATTTVTVDQTGNGGYWYPLGTYTLDPATAVVTVRNQGTSGYVVADAVRFVSQ